MISVTDLRSGDFFELDGQPFLVLKYTHAALGRKKARVKLQVRNLKTSAVLSKTFLGNKKLNEVKLEKNKLVFLYFDGKEYHFQDPDNNEEFEIEKQIMGKKGTFLKKKDKVDALFWNQSFISIELPITVNLKVIEADPGIKGNTSANIYKFAKFENGLRMKVPLFVKAGDIIKIDTRNGEYVERMIKN